MTAAGPFDGAGLGLAVDLVIGVGASAASASSRCPGTVSIGSGKVMTLDRRCGRSSVSSPLRALVP